MVEQDPHAWWNLTLQAVNAALDAAAATAARCKASR